MENEKTHLENGQVVMAERKAVSSDTEKQKSEPQYLFSKDKLLQQLRECAWDIKCGNPTVIIPDSCHQLKPGIYTGEELGAMIYFIADMLE